MLNAKLEETIAALLDHATACAEGRDEDGARSLAEGAARLLEGAAAAGDGGGAPAPPGLSDGARALLRSVLKRLSGLGFDAGGGNVSLADFAPGYWSSEQLGSAATDLWLLVDDA